MAIAILPAIIVSFVVLVGLLGTYYIYHAYRRMRFAIPDVERTRHIENVDHFKQHPVQLHDVELPHKQYHSSQWYSSENVVPAHVAPVATALPHSPEIEYTGGEGLVSPPRRVFLSTEDAKESSKGRTRETGYFQEQDLHAERTWNFETDGYGNSIEQQPELLSPKPMRTVTRKPKLERANTAYDPEQTAAANIWEKINQGELQPSRRKTEKKLPKSQNVPKPEVLRDPTEFENDLLRDIDLGSSTKEWAKARVSSAYVTKRPSNRESFGGMTTVVDANNVNIERPVSYVKRKQNIGTEVAKPTPPLDRTAEARRKMLEAREQMKERKRQEEEDRQAEERKQVEEQEQRAAEQKNLAEEKQQLRRDEKARPSTQITEFENEGPSESRDPESRIQSTRRKSNTSTVSKRERKSSERPLPRSPKRANTFANDATKSVDNPPINNKPSGGSVGNTRSMSMTEEKKPDFNATMPSITENSYANDNRRKHLDHEISSSRDSGASNPFSDNTARRSNSTVRTSTSSGYSSKSNNERPVSKDVPEDPIASANDSKAGFTSAQTPSNASSNKSRPQAQRRSNASSNSNCNNTSSSDSPHNTSHPERNNSKSSARSRASADSQSSSKQSTTDREKPERKTSLASRTLGKLSRKSSSSDKRQSDHQQRPVENDRDFKEEKERNSAGSTQSSERDGLGLRGGGKVFVAEPEEMSASEDEDRDVHGDWGKREEDGTNEVEMRGGAGDKVQESGCESGVERDDDEESDAGEVEHSEDVRSEDKHSEDEYFESDRDTEEHDSEDEVSDDDASENGHSGSEASDVEQSDTASLDNESGDEGSDDENEQMLSQERMETVPAKTADKTKA